MKPDQAAPYPKPQPMKQCSSCQSMNEHYRTSCRNCGASL